ncbi:flavin-containing monooxygenase [Gordonia polyisoprenivorans]|uniref:flavin-containing monooxygenase n=1 Tax=Gordonia polyisoprenivorans TaxID=84595 RepID=UPI001AD7D483|nr:NAD(P)/FAD-dependent oxidoreductase [Gordonia polyisoprenivorans]QTI70096.1 NAD(P)/FAD-dependent oxidoreductase [Gordonia polyisoprenivorans]
MSTNPVAEPDVLIVGVGFGGLAALHRLRTDHPDLTVMAVERAESPGGVWRDNSYPGAACDVPTSLYSLSFADNPDWSHTYGRGWEIKNYAESVAAEFVDQIRYGCEVLSATWDSDEQRWCVETSEGPIRSRFVIAAPGALSAPTIPAVQGLDAYEGTVFHTAAWDHAHDLTGRRVAVIGSGASAIQVVPEIVDKVAELVVFQRTPSWVIPRLDRTIGPMERAVYQRFPKAHRAARKFTWLTHEFHVFAMAHHQRVLRAFRAISLAHLRRQVTDPGLRRRLTPDFSIGCKRILISNKWYPALAHPRTRVTGALSSLTPTSAVSADGTEFDVDTVVFATGFTPTSPPLAKVIVGRDGRRLDEVWHGSPSAYRGVEVPDFPNLFLLYGPNTNLGHSSIILMLEAQAYYIGQALTHLKAVDAPTVEVTEAAHDAYVADIDAQLSGTVWNSGGCGSWYIDSTGRNSVMWPTYTGTYRRMMSHFDPADHVLGVPAPVRELLARS